LLSTIKKDSTYCTCITPFLSCFSSNPCAQFDSLAQGAETACHANDCASCHNLNGTISTSPCVFTADEFDPKNPKCLIALQSINEDEDWIRFSLAAATGAKSDLSIRLCDTFRTFRVCVAREIAFVRSRCPKRVAEVVASYKGRTSSEIAKTIPTCNEKLTAYVKDIDCNLCDELPAFTEFSAAPGRVADVLVLLIASATISLSI
jgi:hypothetical protein